MMDERKAMPPNCVTDTLQFWHICSSPLTPQLEASSYVVWGKGGGVFFCCFVWNWLVCWTLVGAI